MRISRICEHTLELDGKRGTCLSLLVDEGYSVSEQDYLLSTSLHKEWRELTVVKNPWKGVDRIRSSLLRSNRVNPLKGCETFVVILNRVVKGKHFLIIRIQ